MTEKPWTLRDHEVLQVLPATASADDYQMEAEHD